VGTRLASNGAPAQKKTIWSKRAAFIVLVLLGLAFWIPPLLRATVWDGTASDGTAGDAEAVRGLLDGPGRDASRSAECDASSGPTKTVAAWSAVNSSRSATEAIVLTATILGKTRRAAVVNGRLHREGDRIIAAGELFRLTSVAEDRIELLRDGKELGGDRHLTVRMAAQHHSTK
jgi:hypothetical protein